MLAMLTPMLQNGRVNGAVRKDAETQAVPKKGAFTQLHQSELKQQ